MNWRFGNTGGVRQDVDREPGAFRVLREQPDAGREIAELVELDAVEHPGVDHVKQGRRLRRHDVSFDFFRREL